MKFLPALALLALLPVGFAWTRKPHSPHRLSGCVARPLPIPKMVRVLDPDYAPDQD